VCSERVKKVRYRSICEKARDEWMCVHIYTRERERGREGERERGREREGEG